MIVFTSICMNYLPKAITLGQSLKKTNPKVKFYIVLTEREVPEIFNEYSGDCVDRVILAKDLGIADFDKFIFKHSIVEASTAVKGSALRYLLETEDDKVVYIDPDIEVYDSLKTLSNLLDTSDIVLTPHLTIPEKNEIDIQNNELCALQHGVYNLGFLAVKNSKDGIEFAKWWESRLKLYCYDDIPKGIFTDQRWCDLAPAYFNVHILKNPGYNMAPWNLSTRHLELINGKKVVNKKHKLVFFHYSGFDSGANEAVFNYYVPDKKEYIYQLRDEYIAKMDKNGQEELGKFKWTYGHYINGEKIDNKIRREYRDKKYFEKITIDPFQLSNEHLRSMLKDTPVAEKENLSTLRRIKRWLLK